MKLELALLVWSVALAFVQMLVAASAATLQVGLPKLAGNRDNMPPLTGWAERAERAHLNIYLAGVPWVRTAVWLVSVVGLILIFAQLV